MGIGLCAVGYSRGRTIMRELIVPDVHESIDRLNRILAMAGKVDHTYFLGDWFDTFQPPRVEDTARFLEENIGDPDKTFIWGNHDLPYAYPRVRGLRCSGFDEFKIPIIKHAMDLAISHFEFTCMTQGWRLSHAGIHPSFKKGFFKAIRKLNGQLADNQLPPLVRAGHCRGGNQRIGGITWLDWNDEFEPIPNLKQIVGHTRGNLPRQKGENWCLDTGLHHYAILEDGKVEIVGVP